MMNNTTKLNGIISKLSSYYHLMKKKTHETSHSLRAHTIGRQL